LLEFIIYELIVCMTTARDIVETLGRERVRLRLGVGRPALSNAISSGEFPASWYQIIKELAAEGDVETLVPLCLFRWKQASQKRGEGDCVSPL
jgi:hypothetical protein